jgi:hypothetical protein
LAVYRLLCNQILRPLKRDLPNPDRWSNQPNWTPPRPDLRGPSQIVSKKVLGIGQMTSQTLLSNRTYPLRGSQGVIFDPILGPSFGGVLAKTPKVAPLNMGPPAQRGSKYDLFWVIFGPLRGSQGVRYDPSRGPILRETLNKRVIWTPLGPIPAGMASGTHPKRDIKQKGPK